jgi:hypothetical protein
VETLSRWLRRVFRSWIFVAQSSLLVGPPRGSVERYGFENAPQRLKAAGGAPLSLTSSISFNPAVVSVNRHRLANRSHAAVYLRNQGPSCDGGEGYDKRRLLLTHSVSALGYHLKTGHTLSVQSRPTGLAEDVIVLPCHSVHLQGLGLGPRSGV